MSLPPAPNRNTLWARTLVDSIRERVGAGMYANFPGGDEPTEASARRIYGEHYDRLADVKSRWDPKNLFRATQNVPPRR